MMMSPTLAAVTLVDYLEERKFVCGSTSLPEETISKLRDALKDDPRIDVPTKFSELNDFILTEHINCFDDTPAFWTKVSIEAKISNKFIDKHVDKINPTAIKIVEGKIKHHGSFDKVEFVSCGEDND